MTSKTTALIPCNHGELNYEGTVKWGVTTSRSYLPKDNSADFAGGESILDWLRQFASKEEDDNTFLRGFLGRMLFSGDEVNKPVNVLSGEKRCAWMLSKLMLLKSNVLVLDDPTKSLGFGIYFKFERWIEKLQRINHLCQSRP